MLLAFVATGFVAQAQRETDADDHDEVEVKAKHHKCAGGCCATKSSKKATKNHATAEFGLAGGLGNTSFNLNEGGAMLRGRYFVTNGLALRLGLNVNVASEKDNFYGTGIDDGKVGTLRETESLFMVNLGVEKHFGGTDRLSPYVGADLLLGMFSESAKAENTNGTSYVQDFMMESSGPGASGVGLRAVFGADFYFAKHVYLGAEAGLGFFASKEGTTTVTTTVGGVTTTTETLSPGSSFNLSPSVITGVRIGFVF